MGLDMYAYCAARAGAQREYYDAEYGEDESLRGTAPEPRELAYWRKHPNLHGWFEKLAESKNLEYDTFNGVELELTWEDLDALEQAVNSGTLPATSGFFFGNNADDHYKEEDLAFIRQARAELFSGLKVFYNSSW